MQGTIKRFVRRFIGPVAAALLLFTGITLAFEGATEVIAGGLVQIIRMIETTFSLPSQIAGISSRWQEIALPIEVAIAALAAGLVVGFLVARKPRHANPDAS